jgi:hypothetical protein
VPPERRVVDAKDGITADEQAWVRTEPLVDAKDGITGGRTSFGAPPEPLADAKDGITGGRKRFRAIAGRQGAEEGA